MQSTLLYLGLIGFDRATEEAMRRSVSAHCDAQVAEPESNNVRPRWQVVNYLEADALLIRGAGVVQAQGTRLQFLPALHNAKQSMPLGVDLDQLKMPVALSDIVHLQALGAYTTGFASFNVDQHTRLPWTLQYFENHLSTLCAMYELAGELSRRHHEFDTDHTYHLERDGALDAIIDLPQRRVRLRPGIRPEHVKTGAWLRRPKSANFAPADFLECSLIELGWLYGMHTPELALPERYHNLPIHILRNPKVRSSLLYPRHSHLIDQLWDGPRTVDQLLKVHPTLAPWVERDLYALYLTRCISTQKRTDATEGASSLHGTSSPANPGLLHRLGRRMNTISADLQSIF